MYGYGYTRAAQEQYLEFIPDPEKDPWNPCNDPSRHSESEVQHYLSCLAKNGSMYVVANVGDIQPCNQMSDSDCPSDDHYQYNTNMVYDKTGTLVARYHKKIFSMSTSLIHLRRLNTYILILRLVDLVYLLALIFCLKSRLSR